MSEGSPTPATLPLDAAQTRVLYEALADMRNEVSRLHTELLMERRISAVSLEQLEVALREVQGALLERNNVEAG